MRVLMLFKLKKFVNIMSGFCKKKYNLRILAMKITCKVNIQNLRYKTKQIQKEN